MGVRNFSKSVRIRSIYYVVKSMFSAKKFAKVEVKSKISTRNDHDSYREDEGKFQQVCQEYVGRDQSWDGPCSSYFSGREETRMR